MIGPHHKLTKQAYELCENILIGTDMIADLADRKFIYSIVKAAVIATLFQEEKINPRKIVVELSHMFPHIKLDMNFKNWDLDNE